ncbi:MAG: serine hydrolase domain-containing protein [Bacteroidota bacterium]
MRKVNLLLLAITIIGQAGLLKAQELPITKTKAEDVGLSTSRLANIEKLFNQYIDNQWIPGGVVLVARHGKVAYLESFGHRDIENDIPYQEDDIFRIASMTKPATTVAVLMLYEKGLFNLDDPISKYIPAFDSVSVLSDFSEIDSSYAAVPANQAITIRHLLTHTSGISYDFMSPQIKAIYHKNGANGFGLSHKTATTEEMAAKFAEQPLLHHPGENWTYGHNTDILGYFVEVVSGQTLGEFLEEHVFEPLGMNDTYFYLPKEKFDRLVPIYSDWGRGSLSRVMGKDTTSYPTYGRKDYFAGGGGLSSTVKDYFIFSQMLLNQGEYNGKRILSRKTIDLLTSDQLERMGITPGSLLGSEGFTFGLGVSVRTAKNQRHSHGSVGTFRWGGIFNTKFWIDPQEDMIMVAMAQILPLRHPDIWQKLNTIIYSSIIN